MQVGDLVRIIAPEHIVGWPAGYVGIILEKLEPPDENDLGWLTFDIDYIVTIVRKGKVEHVYVYGNEIELVDESRRPS